MSTGLLCAGSRGGVAAVQHDVGDTVSELHTDRFGHALATLVLDRVVQDTGDDLILVAAVVDHQ